MHENMTKGRRIYMGLLAFVGWFALALQLYLIVATNLQNGGSVATGIVRYFGYFTILTNILAALSLTAPLLSPSSSLGRLFQRPTVITAVAIYIVFVGIGYSAFLRTLWNPTGGQLIADRLLHDVVPTAYIVYWLVFVPKGTLHWSHIPRWLPYPIIYFVYAMIMGTFTAFYPYPFIDAATLGYLGALVNGLGFLAVCVLLGVMFVAIDHFRGRATHG